jgi:CHASE2 domain-containing sensor protein
MAPKSRKTGFWKAFRGVALALVLTGIFQFLEFHGWLASAESNIFDYLLAPAKSDKRGSILTVEIDDDAYKDCFKSTSPLNPKKVLRVVDLVNEANPLVIGVDIITEALEYQSEALKPRNKVVWIAGGEDAYTPPVSFWDWMMGRPNPTVVRPGPVLGHDNLTTALWGLPVFPADEDSTIRRVYQKVVLSPLGDSHRTLDSWALTIARQYCAATNRCKEDVDKTSEETVYLVYGAPTPGRFRFHDLFQCSGESVEKGLFFEAFKEKAKGKIVLIGGTFKSARDTYDTPAGRLPGLLVNAYAIQSEIDGTFLKEENRTAAIILDLSIGWGIGLISWLAHKHHLTWPFWVISAGLVMAAVMCFWWFLGKEYLPGFVGIVLGVMVGRGIEAKREHEKPAH